MKKSVLIVALSTVTGVGILAGSANAANVTTYLPLYWDSTFGNFTSPNIGIGNANSGGISATLIGNASGATTNFNPSTGGAILGNLVSAIITGDFDYTSSDVTGSFDFNLLSNSSPVVNEVLAGGSTTVGSTPFSFNLTTATLNNFNTNLVLQFVTQNGTTVTGNLSNVRVGITTIVPEPSALFGLLSIGALGLVSLKRKSKD